jgi:UPF0271 protein
VRAIDLNADVGEGYDDAALMPYVTSVNIAAGGHTGDAHSIALTVSLAHEHNVRIGVHPSYPDRENFGRVALDLPMAVLAKSLDEQLARVLHAAGSLYHVKPHGALYHRANQSKEVAKVIVAAVRRLNPRLVIVGQAGGLLVDVAREEGFATAGEGFVDRRYAADGTLVPRSQPDALIRSPEAAAAQAVALAARPDVQTLCLHSDTPDAVAVAAAVRRRLEAEGFMPGAGA